MAGVAFFMVPFVYEGGVGRGGGGGRGDDLLWGGGGGGGGGGRGDDLLLNAVLFVPKWSGLSCPFLSSFGKLGVDFILFRAFTQT